MTPMERTIDIGMNKIYLSDGYEGEASNMC